MAGKHWRRRAVVVAATIGLSIVGLPTIDGLAGVGIASAVGTASIGDLVWTDANDNGLKDTAESGKASVVVTLKGAGTDSVLGTADDTTIGTKTTTTAGAYSFTALDPGKYRVIVTIPSGFAATSPAQFDITLATAQAYTVADFFVG